MADQYTTQQRIEAIMALTLSRKVPDSVRPSEEELAAYVDGVLSEQRASEVEEHLAFDKSLYDEWLTIVEMSELVQPVTLDKPVSVSKENVISRFALWLTGGGVGAAALAAVSMVYLVPALYLNQMESGVAQSYDDFTAFYSEDSIARNWPITTSAPKSMNKSFDFGAVPTQLNEQQQAFAVGVRTGLARLVPRDAYWDGVISQLPSGHQTCADSVCEKLQPILQQAGEYAAVAYAACELERGVSGSFWNKQPDTINALAKVLKRHDEAASFYAFFADWQQGFADGDDPHPAICSRIDALLMAGLQ